MKIVEEGKPGTNALGQLQSRKPEAGIRLNLEVAPIGEGLTDVRVFRSPEQPPHEDSGELLPALALPSGVESRGGEGTSCREGTPLTYPYLDEIEEAQTDLSAQALEEHLGSQLAEAGWRLQ